MSRLLRGLFYLIFSFFLLGCQGAGSSLPAPAPTETVGVGARAVPSLSPTLSLPAVPTATARPSRTPRPSATALPTDTPSPTATATTLPTETASPTHSPPPLPSSTATAAVQGAWPEVPPAGEPCAQPPDDYRRVQVGEHLLSTRTLTMLLNAQALYGGPGDLLRITQGSYHSGLGASFGTHDGGGAVDISIRHPVTLELLFDETERMVQALRQAGFAAWYRGPGDLGPDTFPHLHAIAIGDAELSEAARAQLTGEQGYFRGWNGLPQSELAAPDRHGGPLICPWMIELGYSDLREPEE